MQVTEAIEFKKKGRFTVFEFLEAITRLGLKTEGDVARTLANVESYLENRENWTWKDEVKPSPEFYRKVEDILHDTIPLDRPKNPILRMFILPRREDRDEVRSEYRAID